MPPTGRFVARGPPTGHKNKFISAKEACTAAMFMAMMFIATMVQIMSVATRPTAGMLKLFQFQKGKAES
jgi:hypothetical protein